MVAPPYVNTKLLTQMDIVRKRRAQKANMAIQRERANSSLPPSLINTGASITQASPMQAKNFRTPSEMTPVAKRNNNNTTMVPS